MLKPWTVWITTNWKILQEMGIPGHLTSLLRNLYAGQEVTVINRHGTMDLFQTGKGVHQGCIFSSCSFNFYAVYIMWNVGLNEAQAWSKIIWRNINISSDIQMTPLLWEKWRGTKEPLDDSERGEWQSGLKTQHSNLQYAFGSEVPAGRPLGPATLWASEIENTKEKKGILNQYSRDL